MSMINKLIGIWAINKTVSSATPLFMRLLVGMAAVTVCAVISAIVVTILLTGAVWLSYTQMIQQGVTETTAMLIIGAILLAFLAYLMMTLQHHARKLRAGFRKMIYAQEPMSTRLSDISNAFLDGFNDAPAYKA